MNTTDHDPETTDRDYGAVFWDIGGVIVELKSVREGYNGFLSWLADEYDLAAEDPVETWKTELGTYFKSREGTEYRLARDGYRVATNALFPEGEAPPAEEWGPAFERHTTETLRPEDGAVETIRALADAGVYLGVVSDIDAREAENMLGEFGVRDDFDHVTTSEAVGHTKPDARMFESALSKAPVEASEGLMVGDRYEHDVAGGKDAGLDTVAYGEDAYGEKADYEIRDLRELLDVVGVA